MIVFFVYGTFYSSVRHLLWLYLYIKLYILPFKENIMCWDSNGKSKHIIEFKFKYQVYIKLMTCKNAQKSLT